MADAETEAEWAKLRRVEEEKQKAARAIENEKNDKTNLVYLDPKSTKAKGFSRDRDVVMRAVEKFTNYSIIFVVFGVVLSIIGRVGGMVSDANHLGMGAMVISGLPGMLGMVCLAAAVISAIIGIISSFWTKTKYGAKTNYTLRASIITLIIFGVFELIWYNI